MPTLDWIGKKAVENHHNEVPYRLLRCNPELSVGEPGSGNLLVQGDNLEALKALLPYYGGKVKCIYIDPPYNTGNENWAYNDAVNSPEMRQWLGNVVGRDDLSRHDKWLCMMYPRLALLREFLTEDGAIFVSIDDNEVAHLRIVLDEIFGETNMVAEMIWEGAFKNDARQIGVNHEYVLVYGKNRISLPREWRVSKEGVDSVLREVERLRRIHGVDYRAASKALAGWFRASKATPAFGLRRFHNIDGRGAYKEDDPTAPGGRRFDLVSPLDGQLIPLRLNRGWAFDQQTFNRLVEEGRITFVTPTSVMVRRYLHETDTVTPQSVFYQPTRSGSERLSRLLDSREFEFPKDEVILQKFVEMAASDKEAIVLDSFAGSGTTGHAVLKQNADDGGNRRFILVEMEPSVAREITAERLKRVALGYTNGKGEVVPGLGGGFRFCELGETLFEADGSIRSTVKFADLAAHAFFAEMREPLPAPAGGDTPLIGVARGTAVYLLYNGVLKDKDPKGGNVLTTATLRLLPPHDGPKVVYGTACTLGAGTLKRHGVTFRQIPYEVKAS